MMTLYYCDFSDITDGEYSK